MLEQKLLVGRGEECQIALDDASVSRVHVEVLRTEHGLMILDQGSSNGLRINGADLPSAMLRSGDVVELGDVRLKFVPAGVEDVVMQAAPASVRATDTAVVGMSRSGSSRGGMMALYGGAAVLLVAVIALAVRPSEDAPTVTSVRVEPAEAAEPAEPAAEVTIANRGSDAAGKLLDEAKSLAGENIVLAHRKLAEIPQDSALRQTEAFRAIERQWADELLKAASESPDAEERRSLLDTVAKNPGVDAERRLRAASELAKLDEGLEAVDVADLPSADNRRRQGAKAASVAVNGKPRAVPAQVPRRARPGVVTPAKTQRASVRPAATDSSETDEDRSADAPETPPPAPKPAPKPAPEPTPESELIRDSPF